MLEQLRLDKQLCFRLYSASRLITQQYHPLLAAHGLTYPQYLVLMVLWEKDGQPVNDIARRLYLETNTVTPLLKRMEAEGILRRQKAKADGGAKREDRAGRKDGRQVIVYLTEKGKSLEKAVADIPFRVGNAVSCGSVTQETVPQLFGMLDELICTLAKQS